MSKRRRRSTVLKLLLYIILSAGTLIFTLPFIWMVSVSFKPLNEVFLYPIRWIPNPPLWRNYIDAWEAFPFSIYYLNTIKITLISIVGVTTSSLLAAYGFARLKFRGRDVLFLIVLSTMLLPYQVTIIPRFILFKELGWLNTFLPLTVPMFFGPPFYVFLFRQYFFTLPKELDDAATIDGCGKLQILLYILIPLLKPAIFAVVIFTFMGCWNDFFNPLIYLSSPNKLTITLGLTLFKTEYLTQWNLLMAASVCAIVPCLLIFALSQRYFIKGIALTGIKE